MTKKSETFFADVLEDGTAKFAPHVKRNMARWIKTFKPGTRLAFTIAAYYKRRTLRQNDYYFDVVVPAIAQETGQTNIEHMHDDLKCEHNPIPSVLHPGTFIGGSTADLNTVAFNEYVERVVIWAGEFLGLYIPEPDPTKRRRGR